MLFAVIFDSSFETCYALIEHVWDSFELFKKELDKKFKELGVINTSVREFSHLQNDENYTTTNDMFLIIKYALQNPIFRELI